MFCSKIHCFLNRNLLKKRPPICCILGHVDHGKSTLMDYLKKHETELKITENEHGGITQHVGSFEVKMKESNERITFLDLPGHSAFEEMRRRGAKGADIGILVVAADDGFKEQTKKALEHMKNSNLPFLVAINKIDKPGANVEKSKRQLLENGIELEEFGGETPCVAISALKGTNISLLEETIIAMSDMLELKEESNQFEALIVESKTKKGIGAVTTLIPLSGTLSKSDILYLPVRLTDEPTVCRVRSLVSFNGTSLKKVAPCTPVEVSGWKSLPPVGSKVIKVKSEAVAKKLFKSLVSPLPKALKSNTVTDADGIVSIPVIIKADVSGSLEAVVNMVNSINIAQYKHKLNIVSASLGEISSNDVSSMEELGGALLAFNISAPSAQTNNVFSSNIIYALEDQFKDWIANEKLPKTKILVDLGRAIVLELFDYNKGRVNEFRVLGCEVKQGLAMVNALVYVYRKGKHIASTELQELKHHKKIVKEIENGKQCGIRLQSNSSDIMVGDELIMKKEEYRIAELK